MHVVYNVSQVEIRTYLAITNAACCQFPRVTVYLDADSLELTDEIKVDIMNVQREQTKESVKEFGEKYGMHPSQHTLFRTQRADKIKFDRPYLFTTSQTRRPTLLFATESF